MRQPPGDDRNTPDARADHDELADVACPRCGQVGTLTVQHRLYAKPLGTWSLAGAQPKVNCVEVPVLVCGAAGCGFVEWPSGWKHPEGP